MAQAIPSFFWAMYSQPGLRRGRAGAGPRKPTATRAEGHKIDLRQSVVCRGLTLLRRLFLLTPRSLSLLNLLEALDRLTLALAIFRAVQLVVESGEVDMGIEPIGV